METAIYDVLRQGVTKNSNSMQKRAIILANTMALSHALCLTLFSVYQLAVPNMLKVNYPSLVFMGLGILFAMAFYMMRTGSIAIGHGLLLVSGILCGIVFGKFGQSQFDGYLLFWACMPFALLPQREWKSIGLYLFLIVCGKVYISVANTAGPTFISDLWYPVFLLLTLSMAIYAQAAERDALSDLAIQEALQIENIKHMSSEKEAQMSVKNSDVLIEALTHDMASSIMSATFMIDLLKKSLQQEPLLEDKSGSIMRNLQRLDATITNMHEITHKVVSMRSVHLSTDQVSLEPVKIGIILNKLKNIFSTHLETKKITLNVKSNLDDATIMCDEVILINHVLGNILSNAIKFTHADGVIDFELVEGDDDQIVFRIKDSGIGIPPDLLEKLLAGEVAGSRRGTKGEKGTGLGFKLCMHFTKKMRGHIEIKSSHIPPTGTQFIVSMKKA